MSFFNASSTFFISTFNSPPTINPAFTPISDAFKLLCVSVLITLFVFLSTSVIFSCAPSITEIPAELVSVFTVEVPVSVIVVFADSVTIPIEISPHFVL